MDYIWSEEEMRKVLVELDTRELPFKKYTLFNDKKEMHIIGEGGYAYVLDSYPRQADTNAKYAVKVIGFKRKRIDDVSFDESINAQGKIFSDNLVGVKATATLKVWLDDNNNIINTHKKGFFDEDKVEDNRDFLELHFVLMEKLRPVVEDRKLGINGVYPEKLAMQDRDEILKFAYDIGTVLAEAHKAKVLHRDIKLENVFYDPKHKRYKLGDFGIAKITEDGAANTIAYTKGYGAPEVVTAKDDKYDNTADIYSFGMMLYLILNNLKFPGSGTFYYNKDIQYASGFVLPPPEMPFPELFDIVKKMCSYNPDDRFQSMYDVLNELEGIMVNDELAWKRADNVPMQVLASAALIIGAFFYKLTYSNGQAFELNILEYLFLGAVLFRSLQKEVFAKKVTIWNLVIYSSGIASIVVAGFAWWKLVIILMVFLSDRYYAGVCSAMAIASNVAWLIIQSGVIPTSDYETIKWVPILFMTMGFCILMQYMVLQLRDIKILNQYFGGKINFWLLVMFLYLSVAFYGWMLSQGNTGGILESLMPHVVRFAVETDVYKAGLLGFLICLVIWGREVINRKIKKQDRNKE